jgi:REP element-mobilizing transposase RayT
MKPLVPDICFHIFNHANGFENFFKEAENYRFFLEKYQLHVYPIAETYAYCLMPNHFHLVVRIRKREVIENLIRNKNNSLVVNTSKVQNFGSVTNHEIEKFLSKQFANLFSSYTQSFNKVYKRMGSLFIKNFKREPISDKTHFLNAIIYTHRNPIHHGFCKSFDEWPYSSYPGIIYGVEGIVETDKMLKIVGSIDDFIEMHKSNLDRFEGKTILEIP